MDTLMLTDPCGASKCDIQALNAWLIAVVTAPYCAA